jgi:hypothetical protein
MKKKYKIFNFFAENHDLILLDSEIEEIINLLKKKKRKK